MPEFHNIIKPEFITPQHRSISNSLNKYCIGDEIESKYIPNYKLTSPNKGKKYSNNEIMTPYGMRKFAESRIK